MKKIFITTIFAMFLGIVANAQNYGEYHRRTQLFEFRDNYFGFRIGPNFARVPSDIPALDGDKIKTGLNIGVAAGTRMVNTAPLYVESGLYFAQKGGKGTNPNTKGDVSYSLNYLEIPLLFKYRHDMDGVMTIEPYLGGYLAFGVGGEIKDYDSRSTCSSFARGRYDTCDAGLKFGVGFSYEVIYMEVGYSLGLTNICDDHFDTTHNRVWQINFGFNL